MLNKKLEKKEKAKDTGLAVTLLLLLIIFFANQNFLLGPAIIVLVATMSWPMLFAPLSKVWFGLSELLGGVVSKIVLTIIFFCVVTPVGLFRKFGGSDSMKLKGWRSDSTTVFCKRDHTYTAADLERPY